MRHFVVALFILFTTSCVYAADYANPIGMEFNHIKAGSFLMGSPEDEVGRVSDESIHKVTLSKDFFMQTTEVTQAQWLTVMGSNPANFKNCGLDCPVESISWVDVQVFIDKLNQRGHGIYALPTEAQWEYAARAGTASAFPNGGLDYRVQCYPSVLSEIGWYCFNSSRRPNSVKQLTPNAWGLYDMHGNVGEWVQDYYGEYPDGPVSDPVRDAGSQRVVRGGGYNTWAYFCRSASRSKWPQMWGRTDIGFRVVMLEPPAGYVLPEKPPEEPEPALPESGSVVIEIGVYNVTITWERVR